ncbi:MAG: L-histidine N(alpha)-methyltransferase [Gemmatimonadaceae bacterium]
MTAPREERLTALVAATADGDGYPSTTLGDEVLRGLRSQPKTLPPKLFYDATGAELFERISELPEYYLTRAEVSTLEDHTSETVRFAGPRGALGEYGSGAGVKVRLLLDALREPVAYVPIDISREQLAAVGGALAAEYPRISVLPVYADYTRPLDLPPLPGSARRLAFFPGSTIGNFAPMEAVAFLRRIRRTIGPEGALILGVDRRKSARVLEAAYNDAEGITAAFNVNVLRRLNRELRANFEIGKFRHQAFFNDEPSRIEMHLVSTARQTVTVAGEQIAFECGETIWTESSYKYDQERLEQVVSGAGLQVTRIWSDDEERFWVAYLTAERVV